MRTRSMLLAVATALAMVVLTAGLAFATNGWDDHRAGYTTGQQVTSTQLQPQTQPPCDSVRSDRTRIDQHWCDQAAVHSPTAARTAHRDDTCTARTDHRTGRVRGPQQAPTICVTGARAPATNQPSNRARQDNRHQRRDEPRSSHGQCQDNRR